MKCKEFKILIDDFIEGALPSGQLAQFEEHMKECSSCSKEYAETANLLEMVNILPKDVTPRHDLWSNIESRISDGRGRIFSFRSLSSGDLSPAGRDIDRKNKYLKYAAVSLIAAMILVALLPSIFLDKDTPILNKVNIPYWKVTTLQGTSVSGANIMKGVDSLKPGEWLETKDSSRAVLDVPGLGKVTIEPNTKIQFVKSDTGEHRISLEYGTIKADINSKPRTFFVDSRSATAVDLGCSYTYTVQQNGDGVLYVKEGTVALESHGRESIVPAGKFCLAKTDIGPGTPFRENTSAALKEALLKYDFEKGGEKEVETILKNSKKADVVTLMNLLPRVDDSHKTRVYMVITNFAPPPKNIAGDSIPKINSKELNEWIQEFQEQWQKEMKENMKRLKEDLKKMNKELRENLSKIPQGEIQFNYDYDFDEETQQKIQMNIEKHLEKLEKLDKIIVIPDEIIEKTIEESLEKASEQIERDSERIEREMERLQERMERMHERMDREKEREHRLKEREKEREERFKEREKEHEERFKEREKEREEREQEREERVKKKQEQHKYKWYWEDNEFHFEEVPENEQLLEAPEKEQDTKTLENDNKPQEENVTPEIQPEGETQIEEEKTN